jgi:hypothetical protein
MGSITCGCNFKDLEKFDIAYKNKAALMSWFLLAGKSCINKVERSAWFLHNKNKNMRISFGYQGPTEKQVLAEESVH